MAHVMCMSSRQPGWEVEWERRNPAGACWAHRVERRPVFLPRPLVLDVKGALETLTQSGARVSIDIGI